MKCLAALFTVVVCTTAVAQNVAIAQPSTVTDSPPVVGEPVVQRTVIEDEGSRISELRVRGQTQRITVQPKVGGLRAYEIVTHDGSRGVSDNQGSASGAIGQRVWRVLTF